MGVEREVHRTFRNVFKARVHFRILDLFLSWKFKTLVFHLVDKCRLSMDLDEQILDQNLNEAEKNASENIEITTVFYEERRMMPSFCNSVVFC